MADHTARNTGDDRGIDPGPPTEPIDVIPPGLYPAGVPLVASGDGTVTVPGVSGEHSPR